MNYKIATASSKTEKILRNHLSIRKDMSNKLDRLRVDPRRELGAHPLHGWLSGKWACWLGSNIRMVYRIDEENKLIVIEAVGTHKIY